MALPKGLRPMRTAFFSGFCMDKSWTNIGNTYIMVYDSTIFAL